MLFEKMVYFIYQNLPLNIIANSTTTTYSYNGNGERITKNNEYYLRDYTGRELAIYNNTADTLKSVNLFGNGMIGIYLSGEDKSMYFAKDHLGTVRTTMNETGEIENATDYYPYGEEITGRSVNYGQLAKYKFCGKERDSETDYDYSIKRYYNYNLGIWNTVDPKFEKYPDISPFAYTLNNPLRYSDPLGDTVTVDPNLLKPIVDKNGNLISYENMTPAQKQQYNFQQWWGTNKDGINKLFGIGGKYETTNINFNLGTMPYPQPSFSNLWNFFALKSESWNGYDALTTVGSHQTDPGDFNRGENSYTPNVPLNQLEFNIWFNPKVYSKSESTAEHE